MIESGFGRTERLELGQKRLQPWPRAKTCNRDVSEPRPPLGLVDVQLLEPLRESPVELSCMTASILEHEHRHALGLPVAKRAEDRALHPSRCLSQGCRKRVELAGRPASEERKGDVEMLPGKRPDGASEEGIALPSDDRIGRIERKRKTEEEP
jgi:hypothetical protein